MITIERSENIIENRTRIYAWQEGDILFSLFESNYDPTISDEASRIAMGQKYCNPKSSSHGKTYQQIYDQELQIPSKEEPLNYERGLQELQEIKAMIYNVTGGQTLSIKEQAQLDTTYMLAWNVHSARRRKNTEPYLKHVVRIAKKFIQVGSSPEVALDPKKLCRYLVLLFLHDVGEDGVNRSFDIRVFEKILEKDGTHIPGNKIATGVTKAKTNEGEPFETLLSDEFHWSNTTMDDLKNILSSPIFPDDIYSSLELLTKSERYKYLQTPEARKLASHEERYQEYLEKSKSNTFDYQKFYAIHKENIKVFSTKCYYGRLFNRGKPLEKKHQEAVIIKGLDKFDNCESTRGSGVSNEKGVEWNQEGVLLANLMLKSGNFSLFKKARGILNAGMEPLEEYIMKLDPQLKELIKNCPYKDFVDYLYPKKILLQN